MHTIQALTAQDHGASSTAKETLALGDQLQYLGAFGVCISQIRKRNTLTGNSSQLCQDQRQIHLVC